MNNKKVAIFGNNEDFIVEMCNYAEEAGMNVCAKSTNGLKALELLSQTNPDAAVVDLVLSGLDGFGVLDYMRKNNENCKAIVVSSITDDKTVRGAISHGACYFFAKPVVAKSVVERIKAETEESEPPAIKDRRRVVTVDERISSIFITIGIPPHIKGYTYLRESIKMAINEPGIINRVTKELYPRIGEKYDTTPSKVERAIRHAIEVAWNRGRTDAISSVFGARVYVGSERPTNSEFIALVADKLILESLE